MDFRLTKKRATFALIFVFVLFILIEGFFLWKSYKKEYNEVTAWEKSYPNFDSFKIVDTPDGKIIENKKEGFSAKVPDGWVVKLYGNEVDILSPEVEFGEYGEPTFGSIKNACGISIQIEEYKNIHPAIKDTAGAEGVRTLIKRVQEKLDGIVDGHKYEVVDVSGYSALKTFTGGKQLFAEVPITNKIYSFQTYLFLEKCEREFNDFLKTVSIK
jgi:hypothetical protein